MSQFHTDEPTEVLHTPQQDRNPGQPFFPTLADEIISEAFSRELSRLLTETAGHDPNAFAEIYRLTSRVLFPVAMLITKHCDHAEEVLQTSYVRIWKEASTFNASVYSPMNWMTNIVRMSAIAFKRRNNDQAYEVSAGPQPLLNTRNLPSFPSAHSKKAAAEFWINDLEPDMQTMVMAAYLHGETREQLSKRFGISASAARSMLRRALLKADALSCELKTPREQRNNG